MYGAAALLTALLFIIVVFYTYTGVVGKHYLWADLALFFISVPKANAPGVLSGEIVIFL